MSDYNTDQFFPEGHGNPERNDGKAEQSKPLISFAFYGAFRDADKKRFEAIQKSDLQKIAAYLQTDIASLAGMRYEVYDSREGKQQADPNHSISRASARFKEFAIYRFWQPDENPSFPHEMTHLVAHRWAEPYQFTTELDTADGQIIIRTLDMVSTSFMQEGLAIAGDDILFQRMLTEGSVTKTIDDFCRDQKDAMPTTLKSVINFDGFGSLPNEIVVPFSASFSKFLLGHYGLAKYKTGYTHIKEILSPEENVHILEEIFRANEEELLKQWRQSLQSM